MKHLLRLAAPLALLLPFVSCQSPSGGPAPGSADCVCGEPDAAVVGCYHRLCVSGAGNPENPACVCGGLAAAGEVGQRVSEGASSTSRLVGKAQILYLEDGKSLRGTLLSDNGTWIELRSGASTRRIEYSELAARSVYRLEKGRTSPNDGLGLAALGDLALEAGYWAHASRHYRDAMDVDPTLAPRLEEAMSRLRKEASEHVLAEAREDMEKRRLTDAEKHLATLLNEFPEEKAAVEAAALLERIHAEGERTRSAPAQDARLEDLFAKPRKGLERAANFNHKGLTNKNQSRAVNSFDNALKNLDKAHAELERIVEKNPGDARVQDLAASLDGEITDLYVSTTLNVVSTHMVQTSYNKALEAVRRALVLAPEDPRLRNASARIESASASSDWGFGWIRRGR